MVVPSKELLKRASDRLTSLGKLDTIIVIFMSICIIYFYSYNKRHVALKVAYLGSNYHGFANQPNVETVEVCL